MAASANESFHIESFPESEPDYYLWEAPDKEPVIRLSLDVVDRLGYEIISKFADINSRGSELGGVLLGRIVEANETTCVIDDYELIDCEYQAGALFSLSDKDKSHMVDQLLRLRRSSYRSVVGFFRSHTRKNLCLDERDLTLLRDYFADVTNVFLLVKPFAAKPSAAGFFIWENGRISAESSYRQFPFKRSELVIRNCETVVPANDVCDAKKIHVANGHDGRWATEARTKNAETTLTASDDNIAPPASDSEWNIWQHSPPSVLSRLNRHLENSAANGTAVAPAPRNEETPVRVEPELHSQPLSGRAWFRWIFVLLFLIAISAAYMESRRVSAVPIAAPASNSLNLYVVRASGGLQLGWNREAVPITTAAHASLQVKDGKRIETLELTTDQLRAGRVVYFPVGNDVTFQLEITDTSNARTVSESIHTADLAATP